MSDRARQFLPFDALKGYREAIREKEKVKVDKIELSEESLEVLNYKLNQVKKGMMVKVVYFCNDEYLSFEGIVAEINVIDRIITIVKNKISFDDILDLSGECIKEEMIEY